MVSAVPSCRPCIPGLAALARDTSVRNRGARSEPLAVVSFHDVKQRSLLRSRGAFVRPGLSFRLAPPSPRLRRAGPLVTLATAAVPSPRPRGEWSADRRTLSFCRACEARPPCPGATGIPLGAPPWRFSAGGRASISGIASGSVQRCSSQPGRRPWRAVSRTSRARGYEPRPQAATPRSAFQVRRRQTPPHERGGAPVSYKVLT